MTVSDTCSCGAFAVLTALGVNVGAANLWDLTKDLHMTSHQFSIATLVFFVSYVAFEVPSNMVLKRFRPSRFIPATMG